MSDCQLYQGSAIVVALSCYSSYVCLQSTRAPARSSALIEVAHVLATRRVVTGAMSSTDCVEQIATLIAVFQVNDGV